MGCQTQAAHGLTGSAEPTAEFGPSLGQGGACGAPTGTGGQEGSPGPGGTQLGTIPDSPHLPGETCPQLLTVALLKCQAPRNRGGSFQAQRALPPGRRRCPGQPRVTRRGPCLPG